MQNPHPSKPALQKPPGYRDHPNHHRPVPPPPPPRKPVFPPSFNPTPKRRRNYCRCFCCFLCTSLFFLILLLFIFSALFYLWFEPKLPVYHLQTIQFPRFNVTVKRDGTFLTAHTMVRFEAKNPNSKITFHYGETHVQITIGDDVELGATSAPGFTQVKGNTTLLKFDTQVSNALINDADGMSLMSDVKTKKIMVSVEVRTKFGLTLDSWHWTLGKMDVKVLCNDVTLKGLDGGVDDNPKCTINFLKWINVH
ncbi:hypothetical protein IFM89_019315 [Coptis chinensis]|uniref:Late embryogenesis abundant protein LEA-2 subgroup domain-containing protein n=1 Tax=Coptis chinensis TaxID=261450 RepID=A0A835IDH0_9MAGN|nr:hypothetical protein IFM89_019315 [Coptis chinensis]